MKTDSGTSLSTSTVAALVVFHTLCSPAASFDDVSSAAPGAPTVYLVWHDAYHLFPSTAIPGLQKRVSELFARNGLSVRMIVAAPDDPLDDYREPRVNAVLSPGEPIGWDLPDDVMAAAIGERHKNYTIFVFFPRLLRAVGLRGGGFRPRQLHDLTRAAGGVLAHELVHVLAPERGHAERGLMAARVTRRTLTRDEVDLDLESQRRARAAVREWVEVVARGANGGDPSAAGLTSALAVDVQSPMAASLIRLPPKI